MNKISYVAKKNVSHESSKREKVRFILVSCQVSKRISISIFTSGKLSFFLNLGFVSQSKLFFCAFFSFSFVFSSRFVKKKQFADGTKTSFAEILLVN